MSVNWERFSGSTDSFALRLSFMPDPDEGVGATPEESTSWGALQVWVDGQNLCAHRDQGEVLQAAHWYFLPFLEWLAENWNPLLHEERLPNTNREETAVVALDRARFAPVLASDDEAAAWDEERYEWRERHALRAARAGGLLPNLVFRRSRDQIEISWDDEPLAGTSRDFTFLSSGGACLLPPSGVAQPLFEVATAATERLLEAHPESARLRKLRDAFRSVTEPIQEKSRLSWLAGLRSRPLTVSPLGAGERLAEAWEHVRRTLDRANPKAAAAVLATEDRSPLVLGGSCQAALLFGSVAPTVSERDVERLAALLIERYDATGEAHERLAAHAEDEPLSLRTPAWEQGYDLAESLHDSIESDTFVDVEAFVESLGITRISLALEDRSIRACSLVGPQHVPTIALNNSYARGTYPNVTRFSLAHELCHLLYDRSHGQRLAIASGPWAPVGIERRANAFAAMFLMPPRLVREAIGACPDPVNTPEAFSFVSARLRVGVVAAAEHLCNLGLVSEEEKESALAHLSSPQRY
jgi:Zn-dependent peptidase ImmA (M78 family)